MRLQLRSSLGKTAEKVIGKQRLTVLVNVSFPAPDAELRSSIEFRRRLKKGTSVPFFIGAPGMGAFLWEKAPP